MRCEEVKRAGRRLRAYRRCRLALGYDAVPFQGD